MRDPSFRKKLYSTETNQLITDKYRSEILLLSMALIRCFEDEMPSVKTSSDEFIKIISAGVASSFLIGFKKGNDLFLEETEEKKE